MFDACPTEVSPGMPSVPCLLEKVYTVSGDEYSSVRHVAVFVTCSCTGLACQVYISAGDMCRWLLGVQILPAIKCVDVSQVCRCYLPNAFKFDSY